MSYRRQGGLGEYDQVGNWGWEFDPPPYDFLAPRNSAPQPAPILRNGRIVAPVPLVLTPTKGVGGCGCGCGGDCGDSNGLGLFEAGFDYTKWSIPDWTFVVVGSYLTLSLLGDMFTAGRAVKRGYRRTRGAYRSLRGRGDE